MAQEKVYVVSLGCPKARVDTEVMIGVMKDKGFELVGSAEEADHLVVNTCSFLQSAIDESKDTAAELASYKTRENQRLVVAGCLPSRFGDTLAEEMPHVDTFLGTSDIHRIADALSGELPKRSYIRQGYSHLYEDLDSERMVTTRGATAFLKLAEGCNRTCSFCIIPAIRGKQRSRPIESVVAEAHKLVAKGIQEIVLVAQDLTSYGTDRRDKRSLVKLLDQLEAIPGLRWIRLMYAYPWNFTDELLQRIKDSDKIVRYVDMPLQHINQRILKDMRRNIQRDAQARLLDRLREIPGMVLRTTFIAGYPGETDSEFQELLNWVQHVKFDRVGVFAYSQEKGTLAGERPDQVPEVVRAVRRDTLLEIQKGIHHEKMQALVGTTHQILVDGSSTTYPMLMEGRYYGQAPDIDGTVLLSPGASGVQIRPGEFVNAQITSAMDYDLVATVLGQA